ILWSIFLFFFWYIIEYSKIGRSVIMKKLFGENHCAFCWSFWMTLGINILDIFVLVDNVNDGTSYIQSVLNNISLLHHTTIIVAPVIFAFMDASFKKLLGSIVEIR